MREKWAGANSNTDETFRVAPFGRFPGVRLVVSRSLRSRERGYGHPKASARSAKMREKWAGANSNRGYGHPKAEGYQATPPARAYHEASVRFNGCEIRPL